MHLKLWSVCAAVLACAAFAAAPGFASAAPVLYSGGAKVALGTEVMANSGKVNFVNGSGSTIFECTSSKFTGNVEKNDSTSGIAISVNSGIFKGTQAAEKCRVGSENAGIYLSGSACLHWRATVFGTAFWALEGGSCSSPGPVELTYLGSVAGTCTYKGYIGLYDTTPGTEPLQMITEASSTFTRSSGSSACPSEFSVGTTYELSTTLGGKLKIQ